MTAASSNAKGVERADAQHPGKGVRGRALVQILGGDQVSKKRKQHRQSSHTPPARPRAPSVPTVFRFTILDYETRQEVDRASRFIEPLVWERDRNAIERIQQAKTAEEVLDLTVQATGMADAAWFERVRQFGPSIVPPMTQRLKASREIADQGTQTLVREHLIAALR